MSDDSQNIYFEEGTNTIYCINDAGEKIYPIDEAKKLLDDKLKSHITGQSGFVHSDVDENNSGFMSPELMQQIETNKLTINNVNKIYFNHIYDNFTIKRVDYSLVNKNEIFIEKIYVKSVSLDDIIQINTTFEINQSGIIVAKIPEKHDTVVDIELCEGAVINPITEVFLYDNKSIPINENMLYENMIAMLEIRYDNESKSIIAVNNFCPEKETSMVNVVRLATASVNNYGNYLNIDKYHVTSATELDANKALLVAAEVNFNESTIDKINKVSIACDEIYYKEAPSGKMLLKRNYTQNNIIKLSNPLKNFTVEFVYNYSDSDSDIFTLYDNTMSPFLSVSIDKNEIKLNNKTFILPNEFYYNKISIINTNGNVFLYENGNIIGFDSIDINTNLNYYSIEDKVVPLADFRIFQENIRIDKNKILKDQKKVFNLNKFIQESSNNIFDDNMNVKIIPEGHIVPFDGADNISDLTQYDCQIVNNDNILIRKLNATDKINKYKELMNPNIVSNNSIVDICPNIDNYVYKAEYTLDINCDKISYSDDPECEIDTLFGIRKDEEDFKLYFDISKYNFAKYVPKTLLTELYSDGNLSINSTPLVSSVAFNNDLLSSETSLKNNDITLEDNNIVVTIHMTNKIDTKVAALFIHTAKLRLSFTNAYLLFDGDDIKDAIFHNDDILYIGDNMDLDIMLKGKGYMMDKVLKYKTVYTDENFDIISVNGILKVLKDNKIYTLDRKYYLEEGIE